jgi:hypothetical protein
MLKLTTKSKTFRRFQSKIVFYNDQTVNFNTGQSSKTVLESYIRIYYLIDFNAIFKKVTGKDLQARYVGFWKEKI